MFTAAAAVAAAPLAAAVAASQTTVIGVLKRIEMAPDGKSAKVLIKNNKGGAMVTVEVTDALTLDRFQKHLIQEGVEVRCRYVVENGENLSKFLEPTAGC
jgi:hypothetical protein